MKCQFRPRLTSFLDCCVPAFPKLWFNVMDGKRICPLHGAIWCSKAKTLIALFPKTNFTVLFSNLAAFFHGLFHGCCLKVFWNSLCSCSSHYTVLVEAPVCCASGPLKLFGIFLFSSVVLWVFWICNLFISPLSWVMHTIFWAHPLYLIGKERHSAKLK